MPPKTKLEKCKACGKLITGRTFYVYTTENTVDAKTQKENKEDEIEEVHFFACEDCINIGRVGIAEHIKE